VGESEEHTRCMMTLVSHPPPPCPSLSFLISSCSWSMIRWFFNRRSFRSRTCYVQCVHRALTVHHRVNKQRCRLVSDSGVGTKKEKTLLLPLKFWAVEKLSQDFPVV